MSETTRKTLLAPDVPAAKTYEAKAYAAASASSPLAPFTLRRRQPGATDVQIDVLFCGVCHSDLHQVRDEWHNSMPTTYPCVPGHEIVGRVVAVGRDVRGFREGDLAAVGCLVDSCRTCPACLDHEEQFCAGPATFTYNSRRSAPRRGHLRRLLGQPGGRRSLHAQGAERARPGRSRAAPLRRHHDLLAAQALERPRRPEGRRRGPGWTRAHGGQDRPRARRPGRRLHDHARQGRGRRPARCARGGDLDPRRRAGEARRQLRLHPRHGLGAARPESVSSAC